MTPALPPTRSPSWRHAISGLALVTCVISTLIGRLGDGTGSWDSAIAGLSLLAFILLQFPDLNRGTKLFLAIATTISLTLLLRPSAQPAADLSAGIGVAGFIATLFVCFGTLGMAASRSALVQRLGYYMATRGPGKRYAALTAGGHLFALLLNFGMLPLLGAMVIRGTTEADSETTAPDSRERRIATRRRVRMALALHRAFVAVLIWSPLTVSTAITLDGIPEASWMESVPVLVVATAVFLLVGLAVDRWVRPPGRPLGMKPQTPVPPHTPAPDERGIRDVPPLIALVIAIFSGAAVISWWAGSPLVIGALIAAPVAAYLWCAQSASGGLATSGGLTASKADTVSIGTRLATAGSVFRTHILSGIAKQRAEVCVVCASGVVGTLIGQAVPAETVAATTQALGLSGPEVLALLPPLAIIAGQFGCNPILTISTLVAALPAPSALGVEPSMVVMTMTGIWALVAGSSPFTGACLLSAKTASTEHQPISARNLGFRLNFIHTLICTLALSGVLYGLA